MSGRLLAVIVAVVVVVAIGVAMGYVYLQHRSGVSTNSSSVSSSTRTSISATTYTTSSSSSTTTSRTMAKPIPSTGFEVSSSLAAICKSVGNGEPLGQNIRWLFEHHNEFRFVLREYPENRTIVWVISGPGREALEILVSHIEQMECVVKHGGNPRAFDPLFRVDAKISAKYVHTEIKWINGTAIEVIKKADNDCAWLVIKLHAQVVKGFFTTGREEAQKLHEVPQEALKICEPYLK